MDFIVGLLKIRFIHDSIIVVVKKVTKVAHFIHGNIIDDAPIIVDKFDR